MSHDISGHLQRSVAQVLARQAPNGLFASAPLITNNDLICVPPAPVEQPKRRRKLWELNSHYHCPIIGTCLEINQLRQLTARFLSDEAPLTDYELHSRIVNNAKQRNPLSVLIHKRLDKDYALGLRRVAKLNTPEELHQYWEQALAEGDLAAALWGLMTHAQADERLCERLYADIHMRAHQHSTGRREQAQRLQTQLDQVQREFETFKVRSREQVKTYTSELRTLRASVQAKQQEIQRLTAEMERLAASTSSDNSREDKLAALAARLEHVEHERESWRAACADANSRTAKAERASAAARTEVSALEQRLAALLADQEPETPTTDLGGCQVLCVGGRLATVEQYRALIRRCNGRFAHHDGGMEDNQNRLEPMLAAADAVICAADYVSHDAYRRTKRFCKRHAKPHALLAHAGLGAFSQALTALELATA